MVGLVFIGAGAGWILMAGLAVVRRSMLIARVERVTKSIALGLGCVLIGVGFLLGTPSAWSKVLVAVVLQYVAVSRAGRSLIRGAT